MLREYKHSNYDELTDMLINEGIPANEHGFEEFKTYVLQNRQEVEGFFTYKFEYELPNVVHFCVKPKYRGCKKAVELVKYLKTIVKKEGLKQIIFHAVCDKKYISKLIEGYFKVKPYAEQDGNKFYIVEV